MSKLQPWGPGPPGQAPPPDLPVPTVSGEPVRGGVAGMFLGGSGGGAAKQSREGGKKSVAVDLGTCTWICWEWGKPATAPALG